MNDGHGRHFPGVAFIPSRGFEEQCRLPAHRSPQKNCLTRLNYRDAICYAGTDLSPVMKSLRVPASPVRRSSQAKFRLTNYN